MLGRLWSVPQRRRALHPSTPRVHGLRQPLLLLCRAVPPPSPPRCRRRRTTDAVDRRHSTATTSGGYILTRVAVDGAGSAVPARGGGRMASSRAAPPPACRLAMGNVVLHKRLQRCVAAHPSRRRHASDLGFDGSSRRLELRHKRRLSTGQLPGDIRCRTSRCLPSRRSSHALCAWNTTATAPLAEDVARKHHHGDGGRAYGWVCTPVWPVWATAMRATSQVKVIIRLLSARTHAPHDPEPSQAKLSMHMSGDGHELQPSRFFHPSS